VLGFAPVIAHPTAPLQQMAGDLERLDGREVAIETFPSLVQRVALYRRIPFFDVLIPLLGQVLAKFHPGISLVTV